MTRKIGRRRLLQGMGAAAVTLPFLRHAASAEADGHPKQLVVLFTPNSAMDASQWRPSSGFELPEIFAELRPYASRTLLVDGVDMAPAADDPKGGHNCMGMMLTGASLHYPNPSQSWVFTANGPSIDHHVGQGLSVEPLVIGARVDRAYGTYCMSYSDARAPVGPIVDPGRAFTRAFGEAGGTDDPAADARVEQRQSVLDLSARHLGDLIPRAPRADRRKLEQHLDEVRALEARLAGPEVSCDPTAPALGYDPWDNAEYPRVIRDQIDIGVQALRCGVTRVVSFQFGSSGGAGTPRGWPGLGISSSEGEHDIVHAWRGETSGSVYTDRVLLEQFYTQQLRYLLDSLGPDLDHTLVFWVKSIGYNHSSSNVPFMLIGGETDGSYRAGRHLDLGGAPNSALLANVANVMGVETPSFGEGPYASGPADLG